MNTDNIFYLTLVNLVIALLMVSTAPAQERSPGEEGFISLSLELGIERSEYLLGEPIHFTVQVKNDTALPVVAHRKIAVGFGYLQILVAFEGGDYKKYLGPRWGIKDVFGDFVATLQPGESMTTSASIFYNHPTRTKKSIPTKYAMLRSGKYSVKAVLNNLGFRERIESEEVTIQLIEPEGDDAAVWEEIKRDPQYAYFIQTGGGTPDASRIAPALEEIQATYPASRYMDHIILALQKHYSREIK